MRNLTLAIDDGLLLEARKLALDQNTTVNRLVRDFLAELVQGRDGRKQARARLRRSMREKRLVVGARTWSREELHER